MAEDKLVAHLANDVTLTIIRGPCSGGQSYWFDIFEDGIHKIYEDALDIDSVLRQYLKKNHTSIVEGDVPTMQPVQTLSAPPPDKKKLQSGMDLIAQLDDLRKREAISKAEYDTLKAKILAILE